MRGSLMISNAKRTTVVNTSSQLILHPKVDPKCFDTDYRDKEVLYFFDTTYSDGWMTFVFISTVSPSLVLSLCLSQD